jgi:hypothetical protein
VPFPLVGKIGMSVSFEWPMLASSTPVKLSASSTRQLVKASSRSSVIQLYRLIPAFFASATATLAYNISLCHHLHTISLFVYGNI